MAKSPRADAFRALDHWRSTDTASAYGAFVREYPLYGATSRDLVARLGDLSGAAVLDLACGTGATTAALLDAVGPAGRVYAVDGSTEMLGVARTTIGDPRVEWLECEAEQLASLGLPPLDAAVCNSAIWQTDMPAALGAVATALRAGAMFACNVGMQFLAMGPRRDRRKPSLIELAMAIAVLDHDFVPSPLGPGPGRRGPLTPGRMRELLGEAGFAADEEELVEFESSLDQERAWLSIPIFTEVQFHGLTYDQRLDCIAKAYERADESNVAPSRWGVFVARRP